ncbi:uncharacterized protein PAN0_008c3420 [Moesziomyces antarcticus]|uniref:Uncharacterized protein n=1 Tax=Pseudozyma antarctica TaxID=84753 RepID=A0A081CEV7_PSEA2|nr:uncharacterized protein PAN0_008c3420 [Moesziomyces antarcticus]GAK65203.1 hypothetical protein PAN0_008c3420 [Moesziomyces antarcticus]
MLGMSKQAELGSDRNGPTACGAASLRRQPLRKAPAIFALFSASNATQSVRKRIRSLAIASNMLPRTAVQLADRYGSSRSRESLETNIETWQVANGAQSHCIIDSSIDPTKIEEA